MKRARSGRPRKASGIVRAWLWRADEKQKVFSRWGGAYTIHPRQGLVRVLRVFRFEGVRRIAWRHCGAHG